MNETPTPSHGGHEPRGPETPQPYEPYRPYGQPQPSRPQPSQPLPGQAPPAGAYPPPAGEDQPTGVLGFSASGSAGGPGGPSSPGGPGGPGITTNAGETNPHEPGRPPKRRRTVAGVAALAVAAGLIGGGAGAGGMYLATQSDGQPAAATSDQGSADESSADAGSSEQTPTTVTLPPGDIQQIADQVRRSVVSINIVTSMGSGGGSGVILSDDGLILTNNHVVSSAPESAQMSVTFDDGTTAKAEVVGQDPVTDLAVIKAEGVSGLQPATLGDSDSLAVGQDVIAIGSPLGLSGTVTSGIVSSVQRPIRTGEAEVAGEASSTVIDAIQTDAAINPGNSGGVLVDAAGQVIGINTAILGESGSIGLGFAIPINQAKPVADQLIDDGTAEHAQLGVSVATATDESDGITSGAGVADVTSGGAAEDAGLEQGDIVTKVDDRAIRDADSLIAAVRSHQPDDEVAITYLRDGEEQTATATLGTDGGQTTIPEQPNQQQPDDQQSGPRDGFPWEN